MHIARVPTRTPPPPTPLHPSRHSTRACKYCTALDNQTRQRSHYHNHNPGKRQNPRPTARNPRSHPDNKNHALRPMQRTRERRSRRCSNAGCYGYFRASARIQSQRHRCDPRIPRRARPRPRYDGSTIIRRYRPRCRRNSNGPHRNIHTQIHRLQTHTRRLHLHRTIRRLVIKAVVNRRRCTLVVCKPHRPSHARTNRRTLVANRRMAADNHRTQIVARSTVFRRVLLRWVGRV